MCADGKQAISREYGRSHFSSRRSAWVCGACTRGLLSSGHSPFFTLSISPRIAINASQKRSSSAKSSDSVGSTIKVPATGNDIVGAWKP
ncbi:Uncharacterised protein [Vibrio cholerae]|uniref:Uncharacterized protein n=1 Tax=Vibrio cholerae TaxID=666 RepID=A0A656AAB7_VIBCL|nr:Uncharacterised protein [Vibrio cholerae]CSD03821.1 Uncharacterised protein [Vibrio cholerae]